MSDHKHVTEAQATACREIAQAYIDRTYGSGWDVAVYPPGHEGDFWVLSLELGEHYWPYEIGDDDDTVVWPAGVWTEAKNHFALALYPTT